MQRHDGTDCSAIIKIVLKERFFCRIIAIFVSL